MSRTFWACTAGLTVGYAALLALMYLAPALTFGLLIGASVALGAWFVLALGRPWRSEAPVMTWLQSGLAWVAVAFDLALLLALLRLHVPAWVYGAILFTQDVVFGWRLVLLRRARSADQVSP